MNFRIVLATLLLAAVGVVYSPNASAQSNCSSTYNATKKFCTPVAPTNFRWYWLFAGLTRGPFESESAVLSDIQSFEPSHQPWCTMSFDHEDHDTSPPTMFAGMATEESHRAYYYVVEYKTDQTPCQQHSTYPFSITQRREIRCPDPIQDGQPWSLVTTGTAGAHCEIPWTSVFDRECKMCKGNPIDIMTGTKVQNEIDYAGSGPFPIRFERAYDSRIAYQTYQGSSHQEYFTPIGIGWTATYFQSITSASDAVWKGARVLRPNGRRLYYNESGGVMSAQPGVVEQLIKLVDTSGNLTGWKFVLPDDTTETYDANGRLISIRNRAGLTQTVTYSGDSPRPQSVSDDFGHTITFGYDSSLMPRLQTITLPDGNQVSFSYSSIQNLTSVTYPGSVTRTYQYELTGSSQSLLTGLTDESSVRFATWTYSSGVPTSSKHAGDVDLFTISYPTASTRTVVDPLGQSRTYGSSVMKGQRLLASNTVVTPGANEPKAMTYDNNGNVATSQDFNNVEVHYSYDLTRNLETSRTEAYGIAKARTITTTWDPTYRVPATITEPNRSTTFGLDSNGNVLTKTVLDLASSASRTWTYAYDSYGRMLTADGPRTDVSDVTTYSYYTCTTGSECGQLHTVTNALGHVTTYNSYNADGKPTQITDPNGLVTTLAYDLRRRLTDRCVGGALPACSGGEKTHLAYLATGLLDRITNPDASYIQYTYDAAHRLTQVSDGAGNSVVYTLDNMGNRTAENTYDPGNALRRTHSRVFNTLNQLWKDVNAAGTAAVTTTFGYDNNSNQTSVAAPLARNSSSLYDELNRLKQITDPASGITQFGYDANDNLTSVTDPRSLVTSYAYNGFGDLTSQTSPDTGVTTSTYDSAGNLGTSTDSRGAVTAYGYDAANRVTSASFTLGGVTDQTISYTYDTGTSQNGRLTGASDADHTLAFTYDTHGRVTGKGQTVGGVTLAMGYGYDSAGRLGNVQLPSGNTVSFGYNSNGQVTSVTLNGSTTILSGITYDPFGPITGWTWGNGTTASRGFDTDGKITQVDNANGQSLKNYGYDDAFRITSVSDALDSTLSWTYGYDSLDRLNSASKAGFSQGWTYDANGNRLTETGSTPSTYTNSTTSNRLSSTSGSLVRSYSYDNAGNTLSFAGATFTYNNRGRMASATNGGITANFTYNALGQRIRRATSSLTTLYVYDEAGHLAGEYTAAGALVQETVWLGDMPVATVRPNGASGVDLFYVHTDHLNTPRLVTDTANNIRWRWDSDAFGTTPPNQNPSGLGAFEYNLRFPGQQYDAVVGLHYNYLREYDPGVGGYTQADPIGLNGGLSPFAYTGGNPLLSIDPMGLDWVLYTGEVLTMYGGKVGDRTNEILMCRATSGLLTPTFDYRNKAYQSVENAGPIPAGNYFVNLKPDPNRIVGSDSSGVTKPSPDGGIERTGYQPSPGGPTMASPDWGFHRARLQPRPGTKSLGRHGNYYLHDSTKGYTHGCIETCGELFEQLFRVRNFGASEIDVVVDYSDTTTYGRTDR